MAFILPPTILEADTRPEPVFEVKKAPTPPPAPRRGTDVRPGVVEWDEYELTAAEEAALDTEFARHRHKWYREVAKRVKKHLASSADANEDNSPLLAQPGKTALRKKGVPALKYSRRQLVKYYKPLRPFFGR